MCNFVGAFIQSFLQQRKGCIRGMCVLSESHAFTVQPLLRK